MDTGNGLWEDDLESTGEGTSGCTLQRSGEKEGENKDHAQSSWQEIS